MRLEPLISFRNEITRVLEIGTTPFGQRRIYQVGPGTFEGEKLRGEILAGGADWMTVEPGGLARLDVRKTLQTHDGALIELAYQGFYSFDEKLTRKLDAGGEAEFGETLFQVQAQFQTGAEDYAWLNGTLAIGEGRETQSGVEYRMFLIQHDKA